jgi:hypothetical protein
MYHPVRIFWKICNELVNKKDGYSTSFFLTFLSACCILRHPVFPPQKTFSKIRPEATMSVLKMVVADDHQVLWGEPHGSDAERVYAACSRNPKSLDELDKLLPEFGADGNLRELMGSSSDHSLEPFDAGLIIVDLAKKWIYAEDSYFGAHRRGACHPRDENKTEIRYEFSKEWQFVAEAKWFRYLQGGGLKSYADSTGPVLGFNEEEFSWDDAEASSSDEAEPSETGESESWDEELSGIHVACANRSCSLVDFKPENAAEERDLQTLEHIISYEQDATESEHRIAVEKKAISAIQIELQAVENLWRRTREPRWELKRIHYEARIGKHEKSISRLEEEQSEAAAMAAELRSLLVTEKSRAMLKKWEDEEKNGETDDLGELPY